jgi:hypothetical protein
VEEGDVEVLQGVDLFDGLETGFVGGSDDGSAFDTASG